MTTATREAKQLFSAVDALLTRDKQAERPAPLPPPELRARLREADGLTQTTVARATGVHRLQVLRWEKGTSEPRNPQRAAYARLLRGLAQQYPSVAGDPDLWEPSVT